MEEATAAAAVAAERACWCCWCSVAEAEGGGGTMPCPPIPGGRQSGSTGRVAIPCMFDHRVKALPITCLNRMNLEQRCLPVPWTDFCPNIATSSIWKPSRLKSPKQERKVVSNEK